MRITHAVAILLLASGANSQQTSECALSKIADRQRVTLHGQIERTSHDLLLRLNNCEPGVLLQYAGEPETGVPAERLRQDKNLRRFKKVSTAQYKSRKDEICHECYRYSVEATFSGILNVAETPPGTTRDQFGFARDGSGKIVANAGWGHPAPVYKYRLIVESVSDVRTKSIGSRVQSGKK